MAKIAASHAQGKVSSDMAFELNARAITAASQFGKDKVINGTVGSILDEAGRLVLLPTVEKIFRDLSSSDIAAYATIAGLPGYLKAAEDLTFRKSRPDAYVSTLATAGGKVGDAVGAEAVVVAAAVTPPIAGSLHAGKVAGGGTVQEGDVIAVMEAMKMEMQVTAHRAGRVALAAAAGTAQALGAVIARIA